MAPPDPKRERAALFECSVRLLATLGGGVCDVVELLLSLRFTRLNTGAAVSPAPTRSGRSVRCGKNGSDDCCSSSAATPACLSCVTPATPGGSTERQ